MKSIIQKVQSEKLFHSSLVGLIVLDKDLTNSQIAEIQVIAGYSNQFEKIKNMVVDEVLFYIPEHFLKNLTKIINTYLDMGVIVHIYSRNLCILGPNKKVKKIKGGQVSTFSMTNRKKGILFLKRGMDIGISFIGLMITVVLGLFLTPVILAESRGPVLFSQIRIGRNGRKFKMYKFRTMEKDAEKKQKKLEGQNEMEGPMFKIKKDPRITKVGKFLRETSLDEFPQFFNVFAGHMSLIGSRPPTEDEFYQYKIQYKKRLCMRPGMSGLWQVNGRNEIYGFEKVLQLDMEYIENWSIPLDLKLMIQTIKIVFLRKGAR